MLYLLLLIVIGLTLSLQISLNEREKYSPKFWKLIPRTKNMGVHKLSPPFLPSLGRRVQPDDYFKFIPTYMGSVIPGKPPVKYSTSCFDRNVATLTVTNFSFTVDFRTEEKNDFFCTDTYLFAYVGSLDITFFASPFWTHHVKFSGPWTEAQLYDLKHNGIRIFKFTDGLTATAYEIFETAMLFFGALIGTHVPDWTAKDNLRFLKNHMNWELEERKIERVNISKNSVQSGDFLGIIRLDGLDPMLCWGMGSRTGHTCVTMWIDGELYVLESTAKSNYWPVDGIQKTPWDQWIKLADDADFSVVHFRLKEEIAKKFDTKKAISYFKSVEGMPYGFHNLFTGWIDTAEDNYPPPLSSKLVQLLAPFADWLTHYLELGETYDFLRQGLNLRLNTKNLGISEAYMEASKRGMSFTDLVTIPELDKWIYHNSNGTKSGHSSVCDVLVTRIWKAGGVFGNLTDSFQATEFTDWDAYVLNIFADDQKRSPDCKRADPNLPYCQILGKYRIDIPDWNSAKPYPNMRERCPSRPPNYERPDHC